MSPDVRQKNNTKKTIRQNGGAVYKVPRQKIVHHVVSELEMADVGHATIY